MKRPPEAQGRMEKRMTDTRVKQISILVERLGSDRELRPRPICLLLSRCTFPSTFSRRGCRNLNDVPSGLPVWQNVCCTSCLSTPMTLFYVFQHRTNRSGWSLVPDDLLSHSYIASVPAVMTMFLVLGFLLRPRDTNLPI